VSSQAARGFFGFDHLAPGADARSDAKRCNESHAIQTGIYCHTDVPDVDVAVPKRRQQRKDEVSVSDRSAEGGGARTIWIDVNPLGVVRASGKAIDAILIDGKPVRRWISTPTNARNPSKPSTINRVIRRTFCALADSFPQDTRERSIIWRRPGS
jgi:hypothetical protein